MPDVVTNALILFKMSLGAQAEQEWQFSVKLFLLQGWLPGCLQCTARFLCRGGNAGHSLPSSAVLPASRSTHVTCCLCMKTQLQPSESPTDSKELLKQVAKL